VLEPDGSMINSRRANGSDYWYRQDIRGSVTNIVEADDDVVKSYTYDAYGNTSASLNTFVNSFAYTGAVIDPETGLYYMNARYYDPETGRFISQDTYRGDGEAYWNLYMYCNGDPVNNTDPSGHIAANIIGAIVGGIIGAVGGYFLGSWLADKIGIKSKLARVLFIGGVTALVGASAAAIGYFIGPYVARAWSWFSAKLAGLIRGTYRSIAKISTFKMTTHINVAKHAWNLVMNKVTENGIKTIINFAIRKGEWLLAKDRL